MPLDNRLQPSSEPVARIVGACRLHTKCTCLVCPWRRLASSRDVRSRQRRILHRRRSHDAQIQTTPDPPPATFARRWIHHRRRSHDRLLASASVSQRHSINRSWGKEMDRRRNYFRLQDLQRRIEKTPRKSRQRRFHALIPTVSSQNLQRKESKFTSSHRSWH